MDKLAIKTIVKMKLINIIIFTASLIIWLTSIFIIFIFISFFSKVGGYVISIWLVLFTPLFLALFLKKYKNKILKNIFELHETEIVYYNNLIMDSKFRRIKNTLNNLSYVKSLAIVIMFTIICYLIIAYLFDMSIADLPYIFTIILI